MASELMVQQREKAQDNSRGVAYARPLKVLSVLAELGPGPHSVAEVNHLLGWTYSVLLRVLTTTVDSGWVTRTSWGMYELHGLAAEAPAEAADPAGQMAAGMLVNGQARAAMTSLQQSTGEVVMLHGVMFLGPVSRHAVVAAAVGRLTDAVAKAAEDAPRTRTGRPLIYGAAGHAMLPWLAPSQANEALSVRGRRLGDLWSEPLGTDLDHIREQGYAVSRSRGGIETIAAPLLVGTSAYGALSMTILSSTMSEPRRGHVYKLRSAAAYIQALLDEARAPGAALQAA